MVPSTTNPSGSVEDVLGAARRVTPWLYWLGAVMDPSGHADELRGFLRALEAHGYAPAVKEVKWTDALAGLSAAEVEQIERQKRRRPATPTVAIHEYLPGEGQPVVHGAVNVMRVMFETDRMPQGWLSPLLDRDELWVPSQFNVETFARSGFPEERMRVLGGTMDFDAFTPGSVTPWDLGAPDGAFTFLTNFDFSERKGWRQLLHAWARAFGPDDDVCLVLKTGSFYVEDGTVEGKIDQFMRSELGAGARDRMAPIRIIWDRLPAPAMPRLYAGADAYVLPSRGEGWGRPYMEALAMGLPTIASRFSANLEFMDEATSWLIDGELVPVSDDADVFNNLYKGHKWFEADVDELAAAMREIASDPDAARAKAAPARAELIRRFGPEPTARRIAELATDAYERFGDRRTKPMSAVIRGRFGSVDSLAVVNDGLANELLGRGQNVHLITPGARPVADDAPVISQSWPPVFDAGSNGPTIAVLHWEFGAPPREWVDEIRRKVDRVWVASDYVRRGYIEGGIPAGIIETIPCGADLDAFRPDGTRFDLPRTAGTTFLFVGGTTWRKGADVLIEGWRRAFGPGDDVQLVVKDFGTKGAYRNQTMGEEIKRIAAAGDTAPIVYLEDELPFDQLPALYRAADVVVLPYRAEGFCLPALEAMACGVPVIHNGEGPTGEFVANAGGWALPATRVPLPENIKLPELSVPGWVYEVDPDDLAERLRAAAADAADRERRAAQAIDQARAYTWSRFADAAEASIATIREEGLPLARDMRRAEIDARSQFALYAPNWDDDAAWKAALDAWIAAFGPADDVTLALYVNGDATAIADRIMSHLASHDEATLPDLALVEPSSVTLTAVAATADAVLTDGAADPVARPELLRRARRIVPAGDVARTRALAADLKAAR